MNLSRLLNIVIVLAPLIYLSITLYKVLKDKDGIQKLYQFKIHKCIDFRKDKKFKYDLKICKYMDTGNYHITIAQVVEKHHQLLL